MQHQQEMVKAFHEKYGFPIAMANEPNRIATNIIASIGHALISEAMKVENEAVVFRVNGDGRLYRTHLLVEELGEALIALAEGDEVAFFDGLCDLLYVTLGTGVAMDLPLEEGFHEVHESNMSKPLPTAADPRMRHREPGYFKPGLEHVLEEHRRGKVRND